MKRIVLVLLLVLAGTAHADPAPPPDGLPLRYELGRSLFGVKVGLAPGVIVQRNSPRPIAYTGYVKLELLRGLVILKTEVLSRPGVEPALWTFDLHLGGELRPASLAGYVLRPVKRLAKRAL